MASASHSPWLLHPVADVLMGCGLLALPLAFLDAAAEPTTTVMVVVAGLAVIINGPHYAATVMRAWHHSPRQRWFMIAASIITVMIVALAHLWPQSLPWLFTAYLSTSPWHYATQNHGIGLLMLARHSPTTPTTNERRALKLAHVGLAVAAIIAMHGAASEGFILRAGFARQTGLATTTAMAMVAIIIGVVVAVRLRRRGASARSLLLLLALLSTSLLWFAAPVWMGMISGQTGALAYAAGAALVHCAQYLWITHFVEGRVAEQRGRGFDLAAWCGWVVAGGIVMFTVAPWLSSRVLGYDLVVSLLIVQAVVNLHHFVVDMTLWRPSDPAVRAPLMSTTVAVGAATRVSTVRALLWMVPLSLLLVLAVVDVVQLAGSSPDASEDMGRRAMAQNEYDVRVWLRAARRSAAANDDEGARANLFRAVELSPTHVEAQRTLCRFLISTDDDASAWSQRASMPATVRDDPELLLLHAAVAKRLDKRSEAEPLIERAIEQLRGRGDAAEVEAHRLLGELRYVSGQKGDAHNELTTALTIATRSLGHDPVVTGELVAVAVALLEVDVEIGQADAALSLAERCFVGAQAINNIELGFRTLAAKARALATRNRAPESLQTWQQALSAANQVDDPRRLMDAWLDYGALLARSEAPLRFRYACALQAARHAALLPPSSTREERTQFIEEAAALVATELGLQAAADVRNDLATVTEAALSAGYAQ